MRKVIFILILLPELFFIGCKEDTPFTPVVIDYRQNMRDLVIDIYEYARIYDSNFIIIPQNGQELITDNGEVDGILQTDYLNVIDATGREDMFYGYFNDNQETSVFDRQYLVDLCQLFEQNNIEVLTIDYCFDQSKVDSSYLLNNENEFISFAANNRELNNIPDYPIKPYNENSDNITKISQAKNFLYLINSESYTLKDDFIEAVLATNYDIIIMDLFHDEEIYTYQEIELLKIKQNGGRRLLICYMSVGEAEDYRYYWKESWNTIKPLWLEPENPDWEGNYKVRYWETDWQSIIFGNSDSYLKRIIDVGFDGVYLDIIDGFEYFEGN